MQGPFHSFGSHSRGSKLCDQTSPTEVVLGLSGHDDYSFLEASGVDSAYDLSSLKYSDATVFSEPFSAHIDRLVSISILAFVLTAMTFFVVVISWANSSRCCQNDPSTESIVTRFLEPTQQPVTRARIAYYR